MTELDENVTREKNKYLNDTTIEDIMMKHSKMFHFRVNLSRSQMEQDIEVLDLTPRAYNCLRRAGINKVGDLINKYSTKDTMSSKQQLRRNRNLGEKTAIDILLKLFYYQFSITPEEEKADYMRSVMESNEPVGI